MSDQAKSRKRTRSAKGLALDEAKEKTKVKRKIVLDDGKTNECQVNNNASNIVTKTNRGESLLRTSKQRKESTSTKSKSLNKKVAEHDQLEFKKSKIIDLCFRNVWNREAKMLKNGKKQIVDNPKVVSKFQTQGDSRDHDGIVIDVEGGMDGIEELDYVDDVLDGEVDGISDFDVEAETAKEVRERSKSIVPPLPGHDGSDPGGRKRNKASNAVVHWSLEKHPQPSTSSGLNMMDEELANMPQVKNLFNKFWEEKMNELKKGEKGKRDCFVKSPSDTTLYAPALVKSPLLTGVNKETERQDQMKSVDNMVSAFVDNVRLEHRQELQEKERWKSSTMNQQPVGFEEARTRADRNVIEAEKFRASVVDPDKGRNIDMPSGDNVNYRAMTEFVTDTGLQEGGVLLLNEPVRSQIMPDRTKTNDLLLQQSHIPHIGAGVSDDDFFHLTCHIDPNLFLKIEKGEFVELEKLLPKDKIGNNRDDNRLEWVQRDGGTYLVPAQKDSKISSFRKWEQAFRAYATIYCGANPQHSWEIWQYITVINTAASSYSWDNVYNYDITFRHLMAFNPQRSWAVTYNQMWNLSMRDPLAKNMTNHKMGSFGGHNFGSYSNSQNKCHTSNSGNGFGGSGSRKKPDYCWNFNKGIPCKFGTKCKFIERCKYCDSPSHGVHNCFKLMKKNENKPVQESKESKDFKMIKTGYV